jgi:hypothetical protein
VDARALLKLLVHDADAVGDQQGQHHGVHQHAREQQARAQR